MSNNLDLLLTSDLDQVNTIDPSWAINRMQEIVTESIAKKDIEIALRAFDQISSVAKISGLTLAKGIYEIYKHWDVFGIDEECVDYIFSRIGVHRHTVERYIKVWKMYAEDEIPPEFVDRIRSLNIKDQVPIANALAQGCTITDDDWKRLAHAPDGMNVSMIVHDIKHQPNRNSKVHILLDRDGSLWVYSNEHERISIGYLDIDNDDPIAQKALNRIISNSGIMKA